jgi:hypothetical protein
MVGTGCRGRNVSVEDRARLSLVTVGVRVAALLLAATAACTEVSGADYEAAGLAPAGAGRVDGAQTAHAVPSEPPGTAALRARSPLAGLRPALCNEGFLVDEVDSGEVVRSESPADHTLYVDAGAAQSVDAPDGSPYKPFRSIADAVAHARAGTQSLRQVSMPRN